MSQPPRDRFEYWIRFTCAFFFFGVVLGLGGIAIQFLGEGLSPATMAMFWGGATLACSLYAARVGDDAWRKLLELIRWWP
jgi:hypothetical protein